MRMSGIGEGGGSQCLLPLLSHVMGSTMAQMEAQTSQPRRCQCVCVCVSVCVCVCAVCVGCAVCVCHVCVSRRRRVCHVTLVSD